MTLIWALVLAVIPGTYSAQASPASTALDWGVNAHLPAGSMDDPAPQMDRAVEMHLSWARLDMRWDFVEPSPQDDVASTGDWHVLDASVHAVRSRGMRTLAILQAPPAWASTNGQDNGTLNGQGQDHWR